MGSQIRGTGMPVALSVFEEPRHDPFGRGYCAGRRDDIVPVLATARLVLRAPRRSDASDRRARRRSPHRRKTARMPHPYGIEDAEQFIATVNRREGEACFVITLDGAPIGICGIDS